MVAPKSEDNEISRDRLAELLNEDLCREYQAIIAYVVYSQVLSGAQYMDIAAQLETHAKQELDHALTISRQIDYLGKMPAVMPKPVRTSKNARDMLRYDLDNENETIRNYRERINVFSVSVEHNALMPALSQASRHVFHPSGQGQSFQFAYLFC